MHRTFPKCLFYKLDRIGIEIYSEVRIPQSKLMEHHGIESLSECQYSMCRKFLTKLVGNGIECPYLLESMAVHTPRLHSAQFLQFLIYFV